MKSLALFFFLGLSFSLTAQDLVQFSYQELEQHVSHFEHKAQQSESNLLISAFEKKPYATSQDGTKSSLGVRCVLSIENLEQPIYVQAGDTLVFTHTNFEYYQGQMQPSQQDQESINQLQQQAQQAQQTLKSKEAQIKELSQQAIRGDERAMKALEKLLNDTSTALDSSQDVNFEKASTAPFYSLTLFSPYKESLEYEIKVIHGPLSIYELTPAYVVFKFEGEAQRYYDDWDAHVKQQNEYQAGSPGFDKILKDSGTISGFVKLLF